MILKNLLSILAGLPVLVFSLTANAEPSKFSDKWLKEISIGYEMGHISPAMAKRLLEVRLDEISRGGKIVLTDLENKNVQVIMGQISDKGQTMMEDATLTDK